jgi:hypothetical protein
MRRLILSVLGTLCLSSTFAHASPLIPDWSPNAVIDAYGRSNPYGWDEQTLQEKVRLGRISALNYPVTVTGVLLPERPALKFLNAKAGEPLFEFLKVVLSLSSDFKDFKGFWEWMGLNDYPDTDTEIPYPFGTKPDYPMGVSKVVRGNQTGLTFSCAVCHSATLFGKPILGMTNRFPRANETFVLGKKAMTAVSPFAFAFLTAATREEKEVYAESRDHIQYVGTKKPVELGLDTALTQVALSLSRRAQTPWAERDEKSAKHPRPNLLDRLTADSKPAVWWNTKYKTRWLSDGSVVSGDPVLTNIIWNEIGRGVDLKELDQWLKNNQETI